MKIRILSIVLTICMVLMLLPATVFAANGDAAELQSLLNGGGTVTLSKDYTIDTTLDVKNIVTLDLNGHVIKMTGSGSVIKVGKGGNLTMTDSNDTATHTDSTLPAGGVITGGNASQGAGGVRINSGSFTMTGGTIANCRAEDGGGVSVAYGSFTMTGGTIANCSAKDGGGVYGGINGSFTLNGGIIANCSAEYGGGVAAYSFTMTGGTIANCKATTSDYTNGGGGVCNSQFFAMSGGTIENCSSTTSGGGVFSRGDFSMSGNAIIRGCSAKAAGGVDLDIGHTFTMTGGIIEACTSTSGTSDAVRISAAPLLTNGGIVKGTVVFALNSAINTTSTARCTKFYNEVTNYGTISGGVYYGGISGSGTVSGTYHTVTFDTNGGSGSITTQWFVNTDKAPALQPATDPTKDGYAFVGWYSGDTKYDFTQPVTQDIILTAKFSNPFAYNITYTLDGGTATNPAIYTVESDAITLNNPVKTGYTFTGWSGTGLSGNNNMNVTIPKGSTGDRTYTAHWNDVTSPVISGIENGKTYCAPQTVTVSDNDGISSVTVNGAEITLDTNGRFTLNTATGTQTVVAIDNAGNVSAEITVTVNEGHTYEWQKDNGQYWKKCKFCDDETAKKDIPTITINGADVVCVTQDYKFSFTLPEGTTDAVYGYEFENKGDDGLPAIIENNELFGIVPVTEYEPSENSFKVYAGAKTADGFEFFVSKTVQIQNEHAGGVATCVELAICDTCGKPYGEVDSTNHNLEKISATDATVTETGNTEYWHCLDCDKYFADENATNEIKLDDTVISKFSPEIIEGTGQSVTEGEKKELAFRSNAAFSDFIRVQLDGKTIDEKYYTVKEGSTVVTLKADYVATLSAGDHTIGIVSEGGTAFATFDVKAKAPQTGDNSHVTLWFVLLFVSGGLTAVTVVYNEKKKYRGKHFAK